MLLLASSRHLLGICRESGLGRLGNAFCKETSGGGGGGGSGYEESRWVVEKMLRSVWIRRALEDLGIEIMVV